MDIKKLIKKVTENEEVRGIPLIYIFTVVKCVLDAISSGECFYEVE